MLTGVSGMNILFYRYGSICEPDIIQSLKGLGNNVDEITVEIYNKDFTPSEGVRLLTDTLFAHSYDFIFSINFYPFISEVCNIFHLRYICWTVDSPIAELYSSAICNPWNRIFLFDRAQYNTFHPYNPDCIFYLPLASNPSRWFSVIQAATSSDISRFTGDISFVGSLYTEKCSLYELSCLPDYLHGYLDSIMLAQSKVYGYNFLEELLSDTLVDALRPVLESKYTFEKETTESDKNGQNTNSEDASPFKNFSGQDFDGNSVDESLFSENAVTVINFWFTGCKPCVAELSKLNELNDAVRAMGGEVVGIKEAASVLESQGAKYRNLSIDSSSDAGKYASNIMAFPTTILVDRNGNIVGDPMLGGIDNQDNYDTLMKQIQSVIDADSSNK